MDAPLYPPAARYEPPRVIPRVMSTKETAIADLQADPAAWPIVKREIPGMDARVDGPLKAHLGSFRPYDKCKLRVQGDGPVELVAFGSANPLAVGSLKAPEAESFRGRAQAIRRSKGGRGRARIEASSEGPRGASATIKLV